MLSFELYRASWSVLVVFVSAPMVFMFTFETCSSKLSWLRSTNPNLWHPVFSCSAVAKCLVSMSNVFSLPSTFPYNYLLCFHQFLNVQM